MALVAYDFGSADHLDGLRGGADFELHVHGSGNSGADRDAGHDTRLKAGLGDRDLVFGSGHGRQGPFAAIVGRRLEALPGCQVGCRDLRPRNSRSGLVNHRSIQAAGRL